MFYFYELNNLNLIQVSVMTFWIKVLWEIDEWCIDYFRLAIIIQLEDYWFDTLTIEVNSTKIV